MPPKILASLGQNGNGNGSSDYALFSEAIAENMIEKPKAKILAGLNDLKAKILAGKVLVQIPKGDIPEYDPLTDGAKAKILAKILAGPLLVQIPKGEIPEYDNLSDGAKAKILAKILAEVSGGANKIIEENLPDSYEESIKNPLKVENAKLRRIAADLQLENYKLKKFFCKF